MKKKKKTTNAGKKTDNIWKKGNEFENTQEKKRWEFSALLLLALKSNLVNENSRKSVRKEFFKGKG